MVSGRIKVVVYKLPNNVYRLVLDVCWGLLFNDCLKCFGLLLGIQSYEATKDRRPEVHQPLTVRMIT